MTALLPSGIRWSILSPTTTSIASVIWKSISFAKFMMAMILPFRRLNTPAKIKGSGAHDVKTIGMMLLLWISCRTRIVIIS